MSRRLVYPALLALPFLVGIVLLKGLTVEIHTFHGNDATLYHLPTILKFSHGIDLERYPAAQTPLFHLLFAGWGKIVGFELWRLRLLNVVISYAAVLALFRLLVRRGLEEQQAFGLSLLLALSPYYLGASFTLLTDNLALLFALLALDRFDRFGEDADLREFALASLAMAAAVLTRQSFLWLALVAAVYLVRSRLPLERKAIAAGIAALALAPFAVLVAVWGGLVPPGSDPASCGLCADRDPVTLRTVGFTLALFGVYAAVMIGPSLTRRLRALRGSRTLRPTGRSRRPRRATPAGSGSSPATCRSCSARRCSSGRSCRSARRRSTCSRAAPARWRCPWSSSRPCCWPRCPWASSTRSTSTRWRWSRWRCWPATRTSTTARTTRASPWRARPSPPTRSASEAQRRSTRSITNTSGSFGPIAGGEPCAP